MNGAGANYTLHRKMVTITITLQTGTEFKWLHRFVTTSHGHKSMCNARQRHAILMTRLPNLTATGNGL